VETAYLTDFTIGYGAVAGQGKCFENLSKREGNPGHESKPVRAPIQAVELFGNVADFFFTIIHFYKPNLQLRNMMGIAR
jgi:hypothetical protein